MLYCIEKTISILNKQILIRCCNTGHGIQILVEGGDQGHIGAVAVISPDTPLEVITFPGHKETIVCEKWASAVYEKYPVPVVVSAGVHYDRPGREGIAAILKGLDQALTDLLTEMENAGK